MKNDINSLAIDSVGETAREINTVAGLDALSVVLDKFEGRIGFITQPYRLAAARAQIAQRRAAIESQAFA